MSLRLRLAAALAAAISLVAPPALASSNPVGGSGAPSARTSQGFARDVALLAPTTPYGAFVRVEAGLDAADVVADHADDLRVLRNYPLISAAFVLGPIASIAALADVATVEYLQDNAELELSGDTSPWATRVRVAQEAVAGGPYTAGPGGAVLDGDGVGVAVVDTGIFAAHPDLSGAVAHNFKFVCATPHAVVASPTCSANRIVDGLTGDPPPTFGFVDVGDTNSDTSSGHGTHVAGIVAGDGTMSTGAYAAGTGPNIKGTYTGVAPGATLHGYGAGEYRSVLFAIESLYHILRYGDTFSPRVSVVNNSWANAAGTPFDPNDIINQLVDALVDNNVTVVFGAGNSGGTGATDTTSGFCKNPKPGVICVANYSDDASPGARDAALSGTSSRGVAADATTATFPDISAPGTGITSTCVRLVQPVCQGPIDELRWDGWYNTVSGTSMAAPHVAGAIALMLQADPTLSPADIEDRIQDSAYKFTFGGAYVDDPQNPGTTGTTSWDKGAGLLDVKATLDALGASHATPAAASSYELIGGDGGDFPRSGGDLVSLKVTQATGSSGAAGFRYDLEAAGLDFSVPVPGSATYRLWQTISGVEYMTSIDASAFNVSAGIGTFPTVTSPAEDVTRTGNVVSFFVPFSKLGNVAAGEPIYRVILNSGISNQLVCVGWGSGSSCPTTFDTAPGKETGISTVAALHPQYGRPYARV